MVRKRDSSETRPVTIADLDDRRAAFVRAYVESGGRPGAAADAAVTAGFAPPGPEGRAAARVRGSELLRHPKVLEVLRDELTRKLNAGAALGVKTLIDLCQNAQSEKVRLSAAQSLIDRGYGPVVSRNANLNATTTIEDLMNMLDEKAGAPSEGSPLEIDHGNAGTWPEESPTEGIG